jgi:hypothetical protein
MKKAKEILNEMEFKNWEELKVYIINKLEEKYGKRSSIHSIVKYKNIEDQLNHFSKEEILSYIIVYKSDIITLSNPNKFATTIAGIRLEGDIRSIKEILDSPNLYAGLAGTFHVISDAYDRFRLLQSLAEIEEGGNQ